ncbi:YceI family protein [Dyella acidiphila]|uniref:YceI family protein n=1 Tax=Dyella acidiphila TaxID=2775866 RepID=A0ABR9GG00_9GAMM|nr:YceI family protein [Dyella acidiphila]
MAAGHQADYHIDSAASQASFQVRLLWLEHIGGNFTQVLGEVAPGPSPDSLVVDAVIPVQSVSMPSKRMRQWLLAPAFFDADHHPTIHFVSDPVAQAELDSGGILTGNLTLRGVTAPVHFAVQPAHCEEQSSTPCHLTLHGRVQRSTFGMTGDHLPLSDSVELNLSITLQRENR